MCSLDRGKSWTINQPIHTALRGIGQLHGTFVAVGDVGVIVRSDAPDHRWTAVPTVTTAHLAAIATARDRLVVVGRSGTILVSNRDGSNWQRSPAPSVSDLTAVACEGKRCLAVGAVGTFLRSDDAGDHWAVGKVPLEDGLTAVGIRGHDVMLGTANNLLLSKDGGWRWSKLYREGTYPVTSIVSSEGGAGIIGFQGHLQRTRRSDRAGVGKFVYLPGLQPWENITGGWINNDGTAIALSDDGMLFSSIDKGETWVPRTSAVDGRRGSLKKAWVDRLGDIYVVGDEGTILVRDAREDQWRTAPPPTVHFSNGHSEPLSSPLVAVWGEMGGDVYICDGVGWLYRSHNGGRTWKGLPQLPYPATSLWGTETEMVAVGEAILRSIDRGRTWTTLLEVGSDSWLSSVWGRSDGQYFAVGTRGLVMFSGDHGLTWQRVESPVASNLNEVTGDANQVWAVGDNGVILRLRSDSKRWQLLPSGLTGSLSSVSRVGMRSLAVVSDRGDIMISQTDGESWILLDPVTINALEKVVATETRVWVFGTFGSILSAAFR